jgi:hypothetical protein
MQTKKGGRSRPPIHVTNSHSSGNLLIRSGRPKQYEVLIKSTGERAMATWKRLTRENKPVDVNLDAVIYMQEHEGFTALHFAAYGGDRTQSISVSETPDEIHKLLALHSND